MSREARLEAALRKLALPLDHPDAIQNTRSDWARLGLDEQITVLDRAEKMTLYARETLRTLDE